MEHYTLQEWVYFTNYPYDENNYLQAVEDYEEFCFKHSLWPILD